MGIGPTKTLAKIASECVKRDKNHPVKNLLNEGDLDSVLETVDVDDVWGIGRQRVGSLLEHGIENARQLRDADERWIRDEFTVVGHRTVQELKGVSCFEMEDVPPPKKNIASAKSFSDPVTSKRELKEAITDFTDRGAEKIREQGSVAGGLQVFIRTSRFRGDQYKNSVYQKLDSPTNATHILADKATDAVEKIYREGYKYKKAGISLTELRPEKHAQRSLWSQNNQNPSEQLMEAIDTINEQHGSDTVHLASAGFDRDWQLCFDHHSPHYTTQWDDIPTAKTSI